MSHRQVKRQHSQVLAVRHTDERCIGVSILRDRDVDLLQLPHLLQSLLKDAGIEQGRHRRRFEADAPDVIGKRRSYAAELEDLLAVSTVHEAKGVDVNLDARHRQIVLTIVQSYPRISRPRALKIVRVQLT